MPAFVILDSISLNTPDGRRLFDGLTFAQSRERTGIVGRNGCGKSTLLRLMTGEVEPASGSVQRIGSIGMLAQLADERETIAQALGVADDLARLRRLQAGEGSLDDATAADWTLEARLQMSLAETGLPDLPLERAIASLSGGERTRIALARLLITAPDVLVLDEPTNNLDSDGRRAVAQLLERWRGGVIVASHDRSASAFSAADGRPLPNSAMPREPAPKPAWTAQRMPCAMPSARFRRRGKRRRAATRPAAPGAPRASRTRCSWIGRRSVPKTALPAKATSPRA
jgi:ABC-type Mn2+/Zn2+ transport system ATPase subunit